MVKLNKKRVALTAAIAVTGGGAIYGAEHGAFHDPRFDVDNSPAVQHKLEKVIKPKLQELGGLTVTLAKKTEGKDYKDTQAYDPKSNTVTIDAEGEDPILGWNHVTAEFAAKPGTHEPDTKRVKYVETIRVVDDSDIPYSTSIELAAPGAKSLDKGYRGHTTTSVYSASEGGGIDFKDDPSLGGPHLSNTRDNEQFIDGEWGDYKHNPVPTAKNIVSHTDKAADIIRTAFEQ